MELSEAKQLQHGLYIFRWINGGRSLAAVGSDREGRPWFAATNWTVVPWYDFGGVASVELIATKTFNPDMVSMHIPKQPVPFPICLPAGRDIKAGEAIWFDPETGTLVGESAL